MSKLNEDKYIGDTRYEKVLEQMQLLGIQDVTTYRQERNGTIVWRLPIKGRGNTHIEYASFATGYVRNQGNQCHSNWQINKCKMNKRYYEYPDGKVHEFDTKERILIPIEIDRLEYMMKYVIKNDFIKRANMLYTNFVPKWQYDNVRNTVIEHGVDQYVPDVKVIIDGQRYNIT